MVYTSDDNGNYVLRLDKGERLSDAFKAFTDDAHITSAWVTIIGGVLEVTLGYYDLDAKTYKWRDFSGVREVTGVQGNIAVNEAGEPMLHAHGTFADADYQVIGGHVKDFVAAATIEMFVQPFAAPLNRKTDPAVGLQTLDV